jgi:hypothetical protein
MPYHKNAYAQVLEKGFPYFHHALIARALLSIQATNIVYVHEIF